MKMRIATLIAVAVFTVGCGSKAPQQTKESASAAGPATTPATPGGQSPTPAAGNPGAPPAAAPEAPPPPPQPKTYTIAAGTPIAIQTMDAVNTKHTKTESEFEGTLANAITVDGKTLAKPGATVIGVVVNADQGGKVKGKASLTLALSRILLTTGNYLTVRTNSVVQQAKSGTKKNMVRTGLMAGGGAAIGAIAGGGKGAAIGAAIGGGAGVATNLATKGPAAEIPAGATLNFSMTQPASVTIQP